MRETTARNRVRIRSLSVPSPFVDRRLVAESHYASLGLSARFSLISTEQRSVVAYFHGDFLFLCLLLLLLLLLMWFVCVECGEGVPHCL